MENCLSNIGRWERIKISTGLAGSPSINVQNLFERIEKELKLKNAMCDFG